MGFIKKMEIEYSEFEVGREAGKKVQEIDEESVQCVICTDYIKYFAIPETCNHNLICWNCVLKQRLKLNQTACSMCKEESNRVLITTDKTQTIAKWDSRMIEEVTNGIVFSNP